MQQTGRHHLLMRQLQPGILLSEGRKLMLLGTDHVPGTLRVLSLLDLQDASKVGSFILYNNLLDQEGQIIVSIGPVGNLRWSL